MGVASLEPVGTERIHALGIPVIDLSWRRDHVLDLIVKACEEFGFFKVINHGVPEKVIDRMEAEAVEFFSLPVQEKQRAGPPNPLGYGIRNIGFNGDIGELEYLLLHANPASVPQRARTIFKKDPIRFSFAVNDYVEAVRDLACDILNMLGEGLGLRDSMTFSRLLRDRESDSLLRLNHYPPYHRNSTCNIEEIRNSNKSKDCRNSKVGFGEHSDPQMLTLLRSNNVPGLQIQSTSGGGIWVPVPPDPMAFCVIVGDTLQAMTNGKLISVRHRAMANAYSSRLSTVFFGAPPLNSWISPLPEMITPKAPRCYKSFTWGEYKKAMYSLRLGQNRLDLFRSDAEQEVISLMAQ